MKLMYCDWCKDIKAIKKTLYSCDCGKVRAKYIDEKEIRNYLDSSKIIWNGEGSILGINDTSFLHALNKDKNVLKPTLLGYDFEAFVIPKSAGSIIIKEDL